MAIPANPEIQLPNLAMAVQTLCYEVRMRWLEVQNQEHSAPEDERSSTPAPSNWKGFYQHLEQTLQRRDFIADDHPGHVMSKLRRLFNRARPKRWS